MKSTPTNRSIMIILMGTKPGYPRKKAFLHLTSDSIRLAAAIGAYGQWPHNHHVLFVETTCIPPPRHKSGQLFEWHFLYNSRWCWTSRRTLATIHGELGSSRIEENPHAATWGAGPVQEVIPQVGEMSFRRAGGICPHDGSEQGRGGSSSAPAPAPRGRCASASSIADGDNVNAAPPHLPQWTGFGRICDHWWGER